jgi:CubicO group peptidase (beta-lactamase class C family)
MIVGMKDRDFQQAIEYIHSWLPFRFSKTEITGLVVAIAHKGRVVYNEAFGYADLESKKKMSPQHIFRIASHSKMFTATAIMQLQEKGKLRIDDPVSKYLPWLKRHSDKRFQVITIRQLLSHSAGVIRDGEDADYWQLFRPFPNEVQFKQELLQSKLVIENNTKMKYSNFGYTLLGLVVEAVAKQPYNTYTQQQIIAPLGLRQTGPEINNDIQDRLATGYTRRELEKRRLPIAHVETGVMSAATGFYSTAKEACAYLSAHDPNSDKLLTAESKKEMQRAQWYAGKGGDDKRYYGLGFDLEYIGKAKVIGHSGGFPGYITRSCYDPENQLVVVVLTNDIDGPASPIATGIMETIQCFKSNRLSTKASLKKFQGRFLSIWGMADIVVAGDKLLSGYPDSWLPLKNAEELARLNEKTLKIVKADTFASEKELVKYSFDSKGKAERIIYSGTTMLPEKDYEASLRSRT